MANTRVLLTGGSGFLGRHLIASLQAQGHQVVALVRSAAEWNRQSWLNEIGPVDLVEGELLDPTPWSLHPALNDVQTVFHLAAVVQHSRHQPEEMYRINIEGTLNIVRWASERKLRVVFVSTSGTVGCFEYPDLVADEQAPYVEKTVRRWPYYDSKVKAELQARSAAEKLGGELVIIRPPVLLGPGDHRFRATKHVTNLLDGKIPFLGKGGMHFTDIRDVASAMSKLATLKKARATYHFPGTCSSLIQFFQMVSEVSGAPLPKLELPAWVALSATRSGEQVRGLFNKAPPKFLPDPVVVEMSAHYWGLSSLWTHAELGYQPRLPRQTLIDTVAWVRNERALAAAKAA